MKHFNIWLIIAILALLAVTCASQWSKKHDVLNDKNTTDLTDTLKLEDIVLYTDKDGEMYFDTSKVKELPDFTGDKIFDKYGHLFDIGEHNTLKLGSIQKSEYNSSHKEKGYFYDLYHKGYYAISDAIYVEEINGILTSIYIKDYTFDINENININKKEAIDIALKEIPSESYAWEHEYWEKQAKEMGKTFYPKPQLIVKKYNESYQLVYDVEVSVSVIETYKVVINPTSGKVLEKRSMNNQCTCNMNPSHVPHNLNLTFYSQGNTTLQRCLLGDHLFKLKRSDIRKIGLTEAIGVPPNMGNEVCWTVPQMNNNPSNTAFWSVQKSYDYFENNHSYIGYNNLPPNPPSNTNHNNQFNLILNGYGGAGSSLSTILGLVINAEIHPNNPLESWVTLDAMGHEFTHGIDRATTNLNSQPIGSEARIIMEGFCDIFATTIKNTYSSPISRYTLLDLVQNAPKRSLSHPHLSVDEFGASDAQPDTYLGNNWYYQPPPVPLPVVIGDGYFIHHNNGIMNYWFYLLCEGGSGTNDNGFNYNVPQIGMTKAAKIAFRTLQFELKQPKYTNKDFQDLRKATLESAKSIYGTCSDEWKSVRKAWDAVGVTGCDWGLKVEAQCTTIGNDCFLEVTACGCTPAPTIEVKEVGSSAAPQTKKGYQRNFQLYDGCGKTFRVSISDKSNPACEGIYEDVICSGGNGSTDPCQNTIYSLPIIVAGTGQKNCKKGRIVTNISGGLAPYSYQWSNGSTSKDLPWVSPGSYSVTVTDMCGNQTVKTFNVISLPKPTVASTITPTCYNTNDGAIDITLTGGKQPFSYSWSNGAITQDINNLSAGNYTVTISDGNECNTQKTFVVNPHSMIFISHQVTPTCENTSNGSIDLSIHSGTPPYTYQWSTGETHQDIANLAAGSYSVTITDANGCQEVRNINVTNLPSMSLMPAPLPSCPLINNGGVDLTITGGTPPYSYTWSNGETTEDITDLAPNLAYSVTVTDANGCTKTGTAYINLDTYTTYDEQNECKRYYICQGNSYTLGSQFSFVGTFCNTCETGYYCPLTNTTRMVSGITDTEINWNGVACTQDNICTFNSLPFLLTLTPPLGNCTQSSFSSPTFEVQCTSNCTACLATEIQFNTMCGDEVISTRCQPIAIPPPNTGGDDYLKVSPNPFTNSLNVSFTTLGSKVSITIFDVTGRQIQTKQINTDKGFNNLQLNLENNISNGVYFLHLTHEDGENNVVKVIKTN